jgi:opacity protein-like surface antigen
METSVLCRTERPAGKGGEVKQARFPLSHVNVTAVERRTLAMKKMLAGAAIGVAVCMLAATVLAGGEPTTGMGTKQLVFQFNGLSALGLSSYNGGGIGFRYFFADGMAIRPGINVDYSKDTQKATSDLLRDGETTMTHFGFSLVLEKYLPTIKSVAPYVGIGAGFGYSKDDLTAPLQPKTSKEETVETGTSFGLRAVAGFQWYFTDNISLGGEYFGAFTHSGTKDEYTDFGGTTSTTAEGSSNAFDWGASYLFLSVGF